MLRRTPLRSDPAKTAEWQRRAQVRAHSKTKSRLCRTGVIRRTSRKRRRQIADRRATVVPDGPRQPVTKGPDHAFRKWISNLTCAVLLGKETTRVDPAHHRTVRCNGDWIRDPNTGELRGNILPLSRLEHRTQHDVGIETYPKSRGLDLELVCERIGQAYRDGWSAFALSYAAQRAGGYQHIDMLSPGVDQHCEAP
jgi:hypothetical protein